MDRITINDNGQIVVNILCDRCGVDISEKKLVHNNGMPIYKISRYDYGYCSDVSVTLCQRCNDALVDWIVKGVKNND